MRTRTVGAFLPAGIRQLLSAFSEVEIVPEGSSIAGFFRTINLYLHLFARYPAMQRALRYKVHSRPETLLDSGWRKWCAVVTTPLP